MTTKETTKEKKTASKTVTAKKKVLYELYLNSDYKRPIIIGALTRAGLINQFNEEEAKYGSESIKATITEDEFNKIINNFLNGGS